MGAPLEKGPGAAAGALLIFGFASLAFTGETMFPPWAPFFGGLAAGRVTAARSKLRSATKTRARLGRQPINPGAADAADLFVVE